MRNLIRRNTSVYTKYKPSLLEVEFGLLLEAIARFWIKLGVARQEELANKNNQTVNTTVGPSAPSSTLPASLGTLALKLRDRHRIGSFSQPWFRDRASLQYEQYNPGSAMKNQKEMDRGSIGGPSTSSMPSQFGEQNRKPTGDQTQKKLLQEEKVKRVPQVGNKIEAQEVTKKSGSVDKKKNPVAHQEKKKAGAQEERKKDIVQEEKKKVVAPEEKKKHTSKKKATSSEEKEGVTREEKRVIKGAKARK